MTPEIYEARLAELAPLESGWCDGDGSPVRPEALDFGRPLPTLVLAPLPCVFPTPEGGLTFEWEHVELEYGPEVGGQLTYHLTMKHTSAETSKRDVALKLLAALREVAP